MISAIIILGFIIALFALCLFLVPHLSLYGIIAITISPLLLLLLWKRPTLNNCQNIFSIIHALVFATTLVFIQNNVFFGLQLFTEVNAVTFFCVYFTVVAIICTLVTAILTHVTNRHYLLFSLGVLFSIVFCCIPQNSIAQNAVCFALLILFVSNFAASAILLNKQISIASELLQVKNIAPRLLLRNVDFSSSIVATAIVCVLSQCSTAQIAIASLTLRILCTILNFVLLFTYLCQPLDYVSQYKMHLLQSNPSDVDLQKVSAQLKERLSTVQPYPLAMMAKNLLVPIVSFQTEGLEKVTETSACFVANHYEAFGPFISVLKFPKITRPWTDSRITDKNTLANQLEEGIDIITRKWLVKPLRKRLPKLVASPLWKIVNCIRPIPVFRKGYNDIKKMLNESADALDCGDNILVFPEKPPLGDHYKNGGVDKLQTGFVEIAPQYKKMTGRDMAFYPLYIDKKGKRMVVGNKVCFNSSYPLHYEKQRIADELYLQLEQLSKEAMSRHNAK